MYILRASCLEDGDVYWSDRRLNLLLMMSFADVHDVHDGMLRRSEYLYMYIDSNFIRRIERMNERKKYIG